MARTRIVLLYKPYGFLSQFTPEGDRQGLSRFGLPAGVYAAGRLDFDSEGLLLLTDDGALARRLTDPRLGHPRSYWVQVEKIPDAAALEKLERGVELSDGRTRPCRAALLSAPPDLPPRAPPVRERASIPTAWLDMTLREGRNRQVRRMTAAVGHPTLRLARHAIGKLTLQGLAPGRWRWVERGEL